MFKKKCKNCEKDISKNYKYCPNCGFSTKKQEDLGMFGRSDLDSSFEEMNFPRGFNMLFNSLMKNLDKQFKNIDQDMGDNIETKKPNLKKGGISISISTVPGKEPKIKVNPFGDTKIKKKDVEKKIKNSKKLPNKRLNTAKLPKKEPSTNVRRLADKVIYEIKIPGVKSLKDISIVQLENSIEIKAVAKDKAYIKLIPIGLPIVDYSLERGKLVLELEAKN